MEIEGLAELEKSGLKVEDPEMYEKVRWLLNIHTVDEWKRLKRSLDTREKRLRFVRIICRLERRTGFQGTFDRHKRFEEKIAHLNHCWSLPTT